jgi:hypothetical protein
MTTRTKKFWTGWVLLASTTLVACGGGAKGTSAGYPGLPGAPARGASYGYAESSAPKAEASSAGAPMAPSDVAPSARSRSEESSEPTAPSERPGLGTEWGETRYSHVTQSEFRRADPDHPAEVASIYYNDREGARAMTRFQDYREIGSAVVNLPWLGVTVSLNDEGGSPLSAFYADGHTYAVGEVGHRYTINVSNHESSPVEVVASVDGLDVLDGKNASYAKRGYLVPAGGSVEIDGFRQSDDNVAAFRFGSVRDSYAARTGSSRNVGIIGVAVFPERGETWTRTEIERRKSADPFPGAHRPRPYASPPPRW